MKLLIIPLFCSLMLTGNLSISQRLNEFHLQDKYTPSNGQSLRNFSSFKDTTDECNIDLENSILMKDVKIIDAGDSSFTITKSQVDKTFPISNISSVKFIRHGFAKGMLYGILASTVVWGIIGLASTHNSEGWNVGGFGFVIGFVLGIPTGLITGLITEFATNDEIYNFGNINALVKAKRLKYIMHEHKSN